MTTWELLRKLNSACNFQTKEGRKVGRASNSELKRWAQNGAVVINDKKFNWNEEIIYPIKSFVLFPKHQITLHLET